MFSCIPHRKSHNHCSPSWKSVLSHIVSTSHRLLFHLDPFSIQLIYFAFISFVGFWLLKAIKPRTAMPRNLDLFFMSVSSGTVSSMSTVEMEVFSNGQLIVMTVLMLIGGEVFLSMVGLYLSTSYSPGSSRIQGKVDSPSKVNPVEDLSQVEMGIAGKASESEHQYKAGLQEDQDLTYRSIKALVLLILSYIVIIHLLGVILLLVYMSVVTGAREVLEKKGLKIITYAIFTIVSSFSSCGFTPNNENMAIFSKNSGLLLIILPQLLLGNTFYPSCLRFLIWLSGKFVRKNEFEYLLKSNVTKIGYDHLLPSMQSRLLPLTALGFIAVQMILFCTMEWNSGLMSGMNGIQKFVGSLFQCVNTRHTGESVVNIAAIAPAILVLFIVMMYLPPYTTFLPSKHDEDCIKQVDGGNHMTIGKRIMENVVFSQLGYLIIYLIAICITERKSLVEDPLNFNVLNIAMEVVSAYGNVGFSTGYSCELRLHPQGSCIDKDYGFAGKWSNQGKIILIIIMFHGRLKKFNLHGGKAWKTT
ncbi:hypothetical protein Droror1_Dr00006743 [Drosera rotundifolia]